MHERLETLETLTTILSSYPRWDWPAIHKTADGLSRAGQDKSYNGLLDMLKTSLTLITKSKARGADLPHIFAGNTAIQTIMQTLSLQDLITLSDDIAAHIDKSKRANLDKKQTILRAINLIAA